ncbi:MAG TPA: alanine--tRNA ligase, partial [Chitinophagaceae bacterium]|nr:alanine--tRNA ligase [Chitinophagaceae bacterium]
IHATEKICGIQYAFSDKPADIAFRVIADHIRAIAFTIADGQLPSNTGAGYVIRRILRRAVRYYFSCLNYKQPLLHQLLPLLADQFAHVFPELKQQEAFVSRVILEEENSFLHTLDKGLKRIEDIMLTRPSVISGTDAFELYDTYGFPYDLTALIAHEHQLEVDESGFKAEMQKQKDRSRSAAAVDTEDWVVVNPCESSDFIGYTHQEADTRLWKYRKVNAKGKSNYQIVLEKTPFYAESGGQVGDTGILQCGNQQIAITDTKKENDLIIHVAEELPLSFEGLVLARIDRSARRKIQRHHTATHLLQAALQQVLGKHIAQKGSLNNADALRFDFSHFAKVSDTELMEVEKIVNRKIRQNIPVVVKTMPKEEALKMGAMALFGEKYGDQVRVVIIDPEYSVELCGGTHVANTGELGIFKITGESAIAAGVRRIEALAGCKAEAWVRSEMQTLQAIREQFRNPKELLKTLGDLQTEHHSLQKQMEKIQEKELQRMIPDLLQNKQEVNGTTFIGRRLSDIGADGLRKLGHDVSKQLSSPWVLCLCSSFQEKAQVLLMMSDDWMKEKNTDAPSVVKKHIASLIKGGGGGQKGMASAGGQDSGRLDEVLSVVQSLL